MPRPTWATAAPFSIIALVGMVSLFLPPPYLLDTGKFVAPIVVFLASAACLVVSMQRPRRSWVDPLGPWLFFVVVAMLRNATGESASQLATLIALPVLWLAMTGTRREIWITAGLVGMLFLGPIVIVGAPEYPIADWRRAVIWVLLAALVAPAINRVVQALASESQRARTASAQMDGIARGARLSSIIATDTDGVVVLFSRGAEEMLGFSAEEVIGRRLDDLHDTDELITVARELGIDPHDPTYGGFAVLRELAHRGAPSRLWSKTRRDGSVLHEQVGVTELSDADGVPTGYLEVGVDATEGVHLIQQLTQSEARWRVLIDHIPDLSVIVLDEHAVILTVAGVGSMRQGLAGHEGESLSAVSRPENMAVLGPCIDAALAGEETVVELLGSTNGAEHEVVLTPLPSDDDAGQVLLVARNVSATRARERELVAARRGAERLFDDAPHGLAVLTTGGVIAQANRALSELLGPDPVELVGTDLAVWAGEDPDTLHRHLERAQYHRGAMVEDLWTVRDIDGVRRHVSLSSRVVDDVEPDGDETREAMVVVNVVDVSERHRYQQRLAHLADHDVLTGLANRRAFDMALERHDQRCRRYGPTGALLLLDLDHFKEVNDTLGHGAGDQLIVSTARLLQQHTRVGDVVARLGGDEFAVLLPEADAAGARVVAENLVARIREHTATLDGTRRRVTASIGAVMFSSVQCASLGDDGLNALALADMTMYDAKDAGRNQFAMLEDGSLAGPRLGARLEWKRRIEAALDNDDFVLHLQPILDLRTGKVDSAEVLIRLADGPELTMPAHFLYVAERSGQIIDLDAWVIRHSIALLADLRRSSPDFRLEVNLSGASINDPRIETAIVEALAQHGVDPDALVLEITETAAVADVQAARAFAERMTQLGCKFALDDFGAGFGSFYYLKHLIFDYVKIDGEFVAECHRSAVDRTIVRSIAGIARGLGKLTVAEHVSDADVLAVVQEEDIDLAQGFHIGKPMGREEFERQYLRLPEAV